MYQHNMNDQKLQQADEIVKETIGDKGIQIAEMKIATPINSVADLLKFINSEYEVWIKTISTNDQSNLNTAIDKITTFTNSNQYNTNIRSLIGNINQLNQKKKIVYSKSAIGKYIKKLSPKEAIGFLSYIVKEPLSHYANSSSSNLHPETYAGIFYGMLYEKGFVKKREIQEILDSPNFVFDEYQEEFEQNILELDKKNSEVTDKTDELIKYIDYIRSTANGHLGYLNKEWNQDAQDLIQEKRERLEELEEQYSEKLKLEGPTQYWHKLSSSYSKKGYLWSVIALFLSAIGGTVIWNMIYHMDFTTDSITNSIQKYLLIAVVISITFYLLNQSVKVALSQFHLSMDYKEREQLTMVYLALLGEKDDAINKNEKEIILQSIFSRSDSGLMKGDAGPTLPNNQFSQILNKLGK